MDDHFYLLYKDGYGFLKRDDSWGTEICNGPNRCWSDIESAEKARAALLKEDDSKPIAILEWL